MTVPLLTTKLFIPSPRRELVARPRLIERLNAVLDRKLTLISAPAGFGKSTLLSEWIHHNKQHACSAWVSLDKGDNDPVRFWDYFFTAIGGLQSGLGENAQNLLHAPQSPPMETVLTILINDIAVTSGNFVLVLDDYHTIESPSIHNSITFLLDHIPPQMHLVLITRADPHLPIPRLRCRDELLEIRTDDMRFTIDEATTFFGQIMNFTLSEEDIAALETRTEGWITGLQMAALSMSGREDISGFISAFSGSHRNILDYLIEEVLQQQGTEVQDFLLKTSVLDRLTADLCNTITGRNDSHNMLHILEHANLFIVPIDESRQWYRYEHLFTNILRHRLDITMGSDHVKVLHKQASQWYESNGLPSDAVHHAIAACDWERSAILLKNHSNSFLSHGEVVTLLNWYQALPEDILLSNPQLGNDYSWALILTGNIDNAESCLEQIEQAVKDNNALLGEIVAKQAYIARMQGNIPRVIELSERSLKLLPKDNYETRGIVAMNLGLFYWHSGFIKEAEQALTEAEDAARQSGNYYVRITSINLLGTIQAAQGKLHKAADLYWQAIKLMEQSPVISLSHVLLGALCYEWNDLETAGNHARLAIELSMQIGNLEILIGGYRILARIEQAKGYRSAALAALQKADHLASENRLPQLEQARNAACHVQVALAQGDLAAALNWVEQVSVDADAWPFYPRLGLARARLLIAQGEKETAAKALTEQSEKATMAGWQYGLVEIQVLQALVAPTPTVAFAFLIEALKSAQPEGYIRTFVDKGKAIAGLLRQIEGPGIAPDYVDKLLSAFEEATKEFSKSDKISPSPLSKRSVSSVQQLAEPLSEREVEVLKLVVAGQSNRQIADNLMISVGTAKTHVHNILGKLNVQGRTEAIARARELNLI